MTKDDLVAWKNNPVTKLYFSQIKERIGDLKDEVFKEVYGEEFHLATRASGAIQALEDILDIDLEGGSPIDY